MVDSEVISDSSVNTWIIIANFFYLGEKHEENNIFGKNIHMARMFRQAVALTGTAS